MTVPGRTPEALSRTRPGFAVDRVRGQSEEATRRRTSLWVEIRLPLSAGCIRDASNSELCRNAADECANRIGDYLDSVVAVNVVSIANPYKIYSRGNDVARAVEYGGGVEVLL